MAAADVSAKRLALDLALEMRDAAIVEAVDLFGASRRPTARAAGVSLPRIEGILVAGHPSRRRRPEVDVSQLPEGA